MKKSFSKDEIQQAATMSIVSVIESFGLHLKKTGKAYSYGENHKLRVYPDSNSYYDFSTGVGGDPINFVQRHLQTNFSEAMNYLLKGEYTQSDFIEQPKEDFHYYFPRNSDTSIGKDYLINERKLDPILVNFLFEKDRIRMDKLNQIIFPWQKDNVIVGATVQGTTYNPEKYPRGRFKGIAKNSESNFSYNISIGRPNKMYVFESPIDMLSYWSMNKDLRDVTFVSTNGAKEAAVFKTLGYLVTNKCQIKDIYVCSDNDRVGQQFYQKLDLGYENLAFHKVIPDDLMIPTDLMTMYQNALAEKNSTIDVRIIAAIHKTETNLSMTNEPTSKEELVFYFGKKLAKDEKPSEYTPEAMKKRIEMLVEDLEFTRIDSYISIKAALENRLKETRSEKVLDQSYLDRIDEYYQLYSEMETLLVGTPVKDWNEKLQQLTDQREQEQMQQSQQQVKPNVRESNPIVSDKEGTAYKKRYVNQERQQEIRVTGTEDEVKADIFQTGQYAGSLEPSSPEEMDQLIKSYGFKAIDKEDVKKYSDQRLDQQQDVEMVL
ncbi:hypothetical protein A5819_003762 [Enterococcus sp. 7E2_DIV0204]|uniref:toprim domain-containing protein n=1 Tax=unclassified Enterococcus TaxID=2608891 RepID=UPI000A348F82|nr:MULTISPECIES: toprim domain-containing protein [unclassified Enterococcus]OTN83782.1 hypothetical protein A5819_003762 [Enterococcus sp. 7E2_DIV0204]OTP47153.1 hypothetical protein A5884_003690 [Enterococcus sp. 7D2_DIV0200]